LSAKAEQQPARQLPQQPTAFGAVSNFVRIF
jgi:hypothetical protein